jgi:hypothetical protein
MKKYFDKLRVLCQLFASNNMITIRNQQQIIYALQEKCFRLESRLKGYEINFDTKIIKTSKLLNLSTHRELQGLFDDAYAIAFDTPTERYTDEIIKMANGWILEPHT